MDEFVRRPKRPKIDLGIPANVPSEIPDVPPPAPKIQPNYHLNSQKTPDSPKPPKLKKFKFRVPIPKTRMQWVITVIILVLLLSGAGFAAYWFIIREVPEPVAYVAPEPEPEPEPEPTTVASRVSGRQIDKNNPDHPIYAVQIENSPEARPQSGLKEADIVSEAVAEGGITRFNAIFHDNTPANIGPVRSLRPYYIDWFLPYNASIVHAGGSPEALSDVRSLSIQDMDHGVNGSYFRRVSNRYAPHNLYTTGAQLLDLFSKKGYSNGTFSSLPRKVIVEEKQEADETPVEPTTPATTLPAANIINLKISSALYNVTFTYDKASNTYLRSQGGAAHKDAESGSQLAPDVVIVPVMSKSIHPDRVHTKYGSVGTGKVYIFQDGTVTEGTWAKPDRRVQWQLNDAAGNPIALNPGQTWFTMIDSASGVSYQ
jgi:hypothetical protein